MQRFLPNYMSIKSMPTFFIIETTQGRKSRAISKLDFELRYFNEKLVFNRYFFVLIVIYN